MTIDDINLGINLHGLEETKKRLCEIVNDFNKERHDLYKQIASLQAKILAINAGINAVGDKKSIEIIEIVNKK